MSNAEQRVYFLKISTTKYADLIEDFEKYCKENDLGYTQVIRKALKQFLNKEFSKAKPN